MPYKPKRPCSHLGCPKVTDGRFCDEHAKQEARRYERYDRDPAAKKRYGRTWKRIRDRYIATHPLCQQCEKHGQIKPAEEVHHIKPLSQGGTNDVSNLMALCTSCHSEITARDGGRWGRRDEPGGGSESLGPVAGERAAGHAHKNQKLNGVLNQGW